MQRICILALIGLPGAGKTQFCHWLLRQTTLPFHTVHLCYDDYLEFATSNAMLSAEAYKKQRLEITKILKNLIETLKSDKKLPTVLATQLKMSLGPNDSEDFLIVCDDNNYYTSMRQHLFKYCRYNSCAYAQIYFVCNLELAKARNQVRSEVARIPAPILERMSLRLEAPNALKHDWEAQTLILPAVDSIYPQEIIIKFILKAFEHVLQPPVVDEPISQPLQQSSALHELDLSLRRRIKELVSTFAGNKQAHALALNGKRLEILKTLAVKDDATLRAEDLGIYIDMLE